MTNHDDLPRFLTRKEAAAFLRSSTKTLSRLASEGGGPPFTKPAGIALYERGALIAWAMGNGGDND